MRMSETISRAVQINGRGIATAFKGRKRSWAEVADRIARLAAGLQAEGLKKGDRVAMYAVNSDRYFEYFFAVAWAGGVFVPINIRLAPPEVQYWLDDSGSRFLFVDDAFLKVVQGLAGRLPSVEKVFYAGEAEVPAGMGSYEGLIESASPGAAVETAPDEMTAIYYTGGTTGRSKGVMLSQRNLLLNALQTMACIGMTPEDNYLHAAPMFHMADGVGSFSCALFAACNTIIPLFDPKLFIETMQAEKVSHALIVPTMVNMVLHHPDLEGADLSSWRILMYGASPMPEALIAMALKKLPHVRMWQAYGQTEAAPVLTLMPPDYHTMEGPRSGKLRAAGRAVPGLQVAILDPEDRELPRGEVGQICGRGDNVMMGYWKMPEQTAETLSSGWLHTGDGGYMDEDGFVFVVDRVKDMIVSGGENVYSAEVENAVYQHPAVAECAVIGIPSEQWGEQVHAVVRCKEGQALDEAGLIAHCKTLIAGYKCPRSVSFVTEPLPLSGAGKILKRELRSSYWEGQGRQVN